MIWWFLETQPADGPWNMAVDEWLLHKSVEAERPALRLYTWQPPTLSLGYAQQLHRTVNLVSCRERGVPVVRRMTGGKAVLHDRELTYAVVGPQNRFPFRTDLLTSYHTLAGAFVRALNRLGVRAELAPRSRSSPTGPTASCFARPSAYEILVDGHKILGSAQKRTRNGVLQHGSLLLDYHPEMWRAVLLSRPGAPDERVTSLRRELGRSPSLKVVADAVRSAFSSVFDIRFEPLELSKDDYETIRRLARDKYPDLLIPFSEQDSE